MAQVSVLATQNLALGTDLSCVTDLSPTLADATGRLNLAQAIARRLSTPRGRLLSDPNYGFDLTGYIYDDLAPPDLARIGSSAEAECLKDERVVSATASISFPGVGNQGSGVLIAQILLVDSKGPFTLVLAVSDVTVTILSVGR